MGLEVASFVNGLVATNPLGADQKAQGDDHIRLIKAVLVATFPNLNAAVTPTPAVLNAIQTAANVTSGTFADARIAASNVTQHQAALALTTAQITSGTFADARIAASNVTQHQAALELTTAQITSGTFADARIAASNVAQHQAALAISAAQVTSGTLAVARGGTGQTTELAFTRRVTLNWTIQSDPGGTPSGTAGDVFAYY
jgi:hypothetical protein